MRRLFLVALVASVSLLGYTSVAGASSFSLEWTGTTGTGATGGNSINVSNTTVETLTMQLGLTADGAGIAGYFVSLRFDTDGDNELNILSVAELSWGNGAGTRTMSNLNPGVETTQESQNVSPEGRIFTFEGGSLGTGIKNASMVFGIVVFQTNPGNVSADGSDLFLGLFNIGLDALADNAGNFIANIGDVFTNASVNTVSVPEPGILALLGVGVGALLLAGRRRS